jgi:hypothetical protein
VRIFDLYVKQSIREQIFIAAQRISLLKEEITREEMVQEGIVFGESTLMMKISKYNILKGG